MVRALAWPVALLVVVLLLRSSIVDLLGRDGLKRLKAGPVEAEWERQLGRIEGEVRRIPRDAPGARPVFTDDLAELAARDPVAAIAEAYAMIAKAIGAVLQEAGIDAPNEAGALELARLAHARGVVSDKSLRAVEGAAVMRNLAVSRPEGTDERRALEYLPLVDAIVYALAHDAATALQRAVLAES